MASRICIMSLGVKGLILIQLLRAEHPVKLNNGGHLHRQFIGFPQALHFPDLLNW